MSARKAQQMLYGLQLLFLLISCYHLDGPFLGAHFERQNQTFDLARHVFRDGWIDVILPRASFSLPGYLFEPFTVSRLEVPFHGLLGWPAVALFGHPNAVTRLVSIAFALASIQFVFLILRRSLEPVSALAGAFIWASAPLVLHFGQVPMPDILATTGIAAAFYLGLRGNLAGSSLCFLFALLAKETCAPFGLPILAALLVAKPGRLVPRALAWAAAPVAGLAAWIALDRFSPPTPWTLLAVGQDPRFGLSTLLGLHFWTTAIGCLFPFGVGILGAAGLALAIRRRPQSSAVLLSVLASSLFYFLFILRKVPEPQYFLPLVFWLSLAAAFGFANVRIPRSLAAVLLAAHLGLVCVMTVNLKKSRVPDFPSIQAAAHLLPPGARVAIFYPHYGGGPAVWLDRNVFPVHDPKNLAAQIDALKAQGFHYAMILDIESSFSAQDPAGYMQPASPFRQFCDSEMKTLYARPHLMLYEM